MGYNGLQGNQLIQVNDGAGHLLYIRHVSNSANVRFAYPLRCHMPLPDRQTINIVCRIILKMGSTPLRRDRELAH